MVHVDCESDAQREAQRRVLVACEAAAQLAAIDAAVGVDVERRKDRVDGELRVRALLQVGAKLAERLRRAVIACVQ